MSASSGGFIGPATGGHRYELARLVTAESARASFSLFGKRDSRTVERLVSSEAKVVTLV
jgi:hypothetical protein